MELSKSFCPGFADGNICEQIQERREVRILKPNGLVLARVVPEVVPAATSARATRLGESADQRYCVVPPTRKYSGVPVFREKVENMFLENSLGVASFPWSVIYSASQEAGERLNVPL